MRRPSRRRAFGRGRAPAPPTPARLATRVLHHIGKEEEGRGDALRAGRLGGAVLTGSRGPSVITPARPPARPPPPPDRPHRAPAPTTRLRLTALVSAVAAPPRLTRRRTDPTFAAAAAAATATTPQSSRTPMPTPFRPAAADDAGAQPGADLPGGGDRAVSCWTRPYPAADATALPRWRRRRARRCCGLAMDGAAQERPWPAAALAAWRQALARGGGRRAAGEHTHPRASQGCATVRRGSGERRRRGGRLPTYTSRLTVTFSAERHCRERKSGWKRVVRLGRAGR